jgi:hypothetical protein
MLHPNRIYLPVTILLLASLACFSPSLNTPEVNQLNTYVAQTVNAVLTQNTIQASFPPDLEQSSTVTITLEPSAFSPAVTLTSMLTLTPSLILLPTPIVPLISVSVPTNCRSGPGKVYDLVGALLVGEVAEIFGRESTNHYWYIRNPDSDPEFCWVWGKYATLTGPAVLMPLFTPPPTPTATLTPLPTLTPTPSPAFNADYAGMDSCNGSWWGEIKIKNTGSIVFKSVNIWVKDKFTGIEVVNLADGFTNLDGCLVKTTKDTLGLGDTYLLSAPAFIYDPTGHQIKMILTLCSDTGQKGTCATRNIEITP